MHKFAICVERCPTGNNDTISCIPTKFINECPKVNTTMYPTKPILGQCSINIGNASIETLNAWKKVLPIIRDNNTILRLFLLETRNFGSQILFCVLVALLFNLMSLFMKIKTSIAMLYFFTFVAEVMFVASISALTYVGLRSETSSIYYISSGIILFLGCVFNFMLYCYWDELSLG
jgi:hypothetical protein